MSMVTRQALSCMLVSSHSSPTWEVTVAPARPYSCLLTRSQPTSLTQEALSGFAEAVGTAFVSLVVSGRVVAATESWWRLGMPEAVLLLWLVGSLPPQAARDYPVYLPHGSPMVPHRLLTLTLLPGLELCLLCGPRPPLSQLDAQAAAPPPGTETLPLHCGAVGG